MRALRKFVGPAVSIKAYADDIVPVAQDLFAGLTRIHYLFERYGSISGLKLNIKNMWLFPYGYIMSKRWLI
jgi:hypothetical protein